MQLSGSFDVADVIMNAFAATFLLDLDGTLYQFGILPEEKKAYMQRWQNNLPSAQKVKREIVIPKYVFILDLAMLCSLFVYLRWKDMYWTSGPGYQHELSDILRHLLYPAAVVRIILMQVAVKRTRWTPEDSESP